MRTFARGRRLARAKPGAMAGIGGRTVKRTRWAQGETAACGAGMRTGRSLLLLLGMQRVPAKAGAVFFQLQLLAARLASDGVVVVAGLLANEENRLDFFLRLAHFSYISWGELAVVRRGPFSGGSETRKYTDCRRLLTSPNLPRNGGPCPAIARAGPLDERSLLRSDGQKTSSRHGRIANI